MRCFNLLLVISILMLAHIDDLHSTDSSGQPCDDLWEKEVRNISSAAETAIDGFYFVNMFGGLLPMPNRYALIVEESSALSFRSPPSLSSPKYMNIENELELHEMQCLSGMMTIGKYEDIYKTDASLRASNTWKTVKNDEQIKDLMILHRIAIGSSNSPESITIIHDYSQFILISDKNPNLWKSMVDGFISTR